MTPRSKYCYALPRLNINDTRIVICLFFSQPDRRQASQGILMENMNKEQSDLSLLGYANQARDFNSLGLRVLFYSIN